MTFEFGPLVRARVVVGDREFTAQKAIVGATWEDFPLELRRTVVRWLKAMLHSHDAVCMWCAGLSISEPVAPCRTCPPIRLTVWDGERETEFTDDQLCGSTDQAG
ncbi:hypothetical protein [Streptomyces kronopolitis]|uniref:hypothetical protein n=1 Tax=Streptomyces kronopolitis TaxID=1612435 RepID=UPI003D97FD67